MSPECTEDTATLKERLCDLARARVVADIQERIQDRMGQGETLKYFLTGTNDALDDETFTIYETYLRRIKQQVRNMSIRL